MKTEIYVRKEDLKGTTMTLLKNVPFLPKIGDHISYMPETSFSGIVEYVNFEFHKDITIITIVID